MINEFMFLAIVRSGMGGTIRYVSYILKLNKFFSFNFTMKINMIGENSDGNIMSSPKFTK